MVKICGITNLEDALASIEAGADAIGFNFHPPSPRYIRPEAARRILQRLPEGTLKIAVLVGSASQLGWEDFDAVQIHGVESESDLPRHRRVIVAVGPEETDRFPKHEILVDPSWGTGRRADWSRLLAVGRPFYLSGGLTPENVGEAVRLLWPRGVDVCSGVESSQGRKDTGKLRDFLRAARTAEASPSKGHVASSKGREEP